MTTTHTEIKYVPGFVADHAATMAAILSEVTPRQHTIRMFGREIPKPRLESWHGDGAYTYSGKRMDPLPWTPSLEALRAALEDATGVRYNSVLVNVYRDGSDSVAFHADDEPELGPSPEDVRIASVSLGDRRRFVVKPRDGGSSESWDLGAGDLLLMGGTLQRTHVHGVPKTTRRVGPRMNLTFRVVG